MKDLDLNDVRTFVAVAQAGTLTAAAKELQLPTSTVSRALTRLEQHLSVLLVQRSPRGLVLTDSGKEYLQSCRRALQTLRHGFQLVEGHRSRPSGLIKVACPVTMARDVLAPLLKEFLRRYPDLRIEIEPYATGWDREPREDVDVFLSCGRRRIPCDTCGHFQAVFEGSSLAQTMSKRSVARRLRMTSPLTTASVPESGS
jgi:LysR family transcriptional regulator, transcriptional activator for dmlA